MGGRHVYEILGNNQSFLHYQIAKLWLLPKISYTWRPPIRPPILYRLNFVIRRPYLFGIKKITFIACFLTSDQFLERKAKNYRFLAFRRNFQIHGMGSRSSKMLKISYGRPWKLVNMTNDRINMIFDCGSWSPFIFSYFTSDIMGGRMGGRQYLMIKITFISKNRNFWVKKCFRSNWNAPPAPPHVCQKSPPPSAPPFQRPSIRPPMNAPHVALKMCLFSKIEVNPWAS